MAMEKITKYTQFFDLLIVGEETNCNFLKDLSQPYFRSVQSLSLNTVNKSGFSCHILMVCGSVSELSSQSIRTLLTQIGRIDTLVLSDDATQLGIYKEALNMRAAYVGKVMLNELELSQALLAVLPVMIKKYSESLVIANQKYIAEHTKTLYSIHKENKAVYANDAFKKFFSFTSLSEFDKSSSLQQILDKSVAPMRTLDDGEGNSRSVLIQTIPINKSETLIEITPFEHFPKQEELIFLNRITFIEVLKDAFLIHHEENEPVPIVIMLIENQDKIVEEFGEDNYNDTCKEILNLAKKHFGSMTQMALWHKDVFLLANESSTLDELKDSLERLHENVLSHAYGQSIIPVLNSFVLDLSKLELNKAINIIDNIHSKKLLSGDLSNLVYHEVFFDDRSHSLADQAIHYLEKLLLSKSQVKLLNFYKGIRISTLGQLLKISDGMVYIGIEKIQGYAMQLEQSIVIQATNLPFDIAAEIKIVDIGKKIAVLRNFEPLRASANNRKHIRIQSDHRMHVTLSALKQVMSATILDISIKSIACRINNSKNMPPVGTLISMQFHLPSKRSDEGSVSMNITGHIEFLHSFDEFTKLVVLLDLEEPYESFLIEYIYSRQQDLIVELKSIVNKL
jgi:GGDEF domain-containing protein